MEQLTKEQFIKTFKAQLHTDYLVDNNEATAEEHFRTLGKLIKQYVMSDWLRRRDEIVKEQKKTAYYFSIEFLPGKMLQTNLLNLGIYDLVAEALADINVDINVLVEAERDMALGNGGLGRLASCFMDSLPTIGAPGFGNGIRYKYGLFKQRIVNGYQVELPDAWLPSEGSVWETKKPHSAVDVKIYGSVYLAPQEDGALKPIYENVKTLHAVPYDVIQIGFNNGVVNNLRLWDVELPEKYELDYQTLADRRRVEDITSFLYPDDSSRDGQAMRLIQEYFMVSAGLQTIVASYAKMHLPMAKIHEKVAVHINDTHPAMAVPELMRILMDDYGVKWDDAWATTCKVMSYTNHTVLSEALEKWDTGLFKEIVPRIHQIVGEIDRKFVKEWAGKVDTGIIDRTRIVQNNQIHMANLAIIGGHSVNGVAKLHTELLIEDVLKEFYVLFPEKFNNKTNGIAQRRWSQIANPGMSALLDDLIGKGWRSNIHELSKLEALLTESDVQSSFYQVKQANKQKLADYVKKTLDIDLPIDAIFDVQVKRLHAYKRQLLNVMHIIKLYQDLKADPGLEMTPRVFIFGAKAAPGYHFAKSVIKIINELANLVNYDTSLNDKLKVVFLENYNVSLAELIVPAADVSEQISTAGKEASGTSNMKFMMNGALTLATLDGANIEIKDAVGEDNIVIFGMDKDAVYAHYDKHDYNSRSIYDSDPTIKRVVDAFIDGTIPNTHYEGHEIWDALISYNDEYFLLEDFTDYAEKQAYISALYQDKPSWQAKVIKNIANSGRFSSDDTIEGYAKDIWGII
ncbi:glycogen/starch/alpha-glucan phosphorylase [Lactococcus piscium]|uniref:Alpha-1,4 glucan phosphorylase n=1 Tax=Pseudolactococcus paracarnosus TaxID=2749962 RepID=A0A7L4WHC8_9LACT|nr:glycogen/starch/alpha-glucan phosphorylase [Lactococcus paracarnosus]MCJ1993825.1 glycogen/starch/alpha-glucan phosphorylase [Lactococcus paracarnosus]QDJ28562.1 glucan phosphorylase [Lactococcus paracarnosus]SPC38187.1 glycogen phosphorylase [Lactococcus piscium]